MTRIFPPGEVVEQHIQRSEMGGDSLWANRYRFATSTNRPLHAIKVFCQECMGGNYEEATKCKTQSCPLWSYRPGTSGGGGNASSLPGQSKPLTTGASDKENDNG